MVRLPSSVSDVGAAAVAGTFNSYFLRMFTLLPLPGNRVYSLRSSPVRVVEVPPPPSMPRGPNGRGMFGIPGNPGGPNGRPEKPLDPSSIVQRLELSQLGRSSSGNGSIKNTTTSPRRHGN